MRVFAKDTRAAIAAWPTAVAEEMIAIFDHVLTDIEAGPPW
jgi:hypothetical protein